MKTKTFVILFTLNLISTLCVAQSIDRKIGSFEILKIAGPFEVFIDKGETEAIKIEPGTIDPERIVTEIEGNALKVFLKKGKDMKVDVKIYITYRSLKEIDKAGSGSLISESLLSAPQFILNCSGSGKTSLQGKLKSPKLTINQSGSGETKINYIETDDLELNLAGSGDVEIATGTAINQKVNVAGSGVVSSYGLKSENTAVAISGSGDVKVYAINSLEGSIAGSGSISYKGDAQVTNSSVRGSGSISKE